MEVYFSGNQKGFDLLSEQLYPFYEDIVPIRKAIRESDYNSKNKLYNIISPELVAWGNSTAYDSNNASSPFSCDDGPVECYINRFFACANYYHASEPKGQQHLVELALCVAKDSEALVSPSNVFNKCTNRIWVPDPYVTLEVCATAINSETIDIFLKAKEKTDSHPEITSCKFLDKLI